MTCSQLANLPCHLGTASVLSFQFQVAGDWTAWLSFLHHHGIQTPHCPPTRLRRLQKSHYVVTVSLVTTVLKWRLKIKEAVTPLGHFMFWAESICNTINDKKKLSKQTCLKINFPYAVITLQNVNENKLHKTTKTEGHLNWNSLDYKTGVIFSRFSGERSAKGAWSATHARGKAPSLVARVWCSSLGSRLPLLAWKRENNKACFAG